VTASMASMAPVLSSKPLSVVVVVPSFTRLKKSAVVKLPLSVMLLLFAVDMVPALFQTLEVSVVKFALLIEMVPLAVLTQVELKNKSALLTALIRPLFVKLCTSIRPVN